MKAKELADKYGVTPTQIGKIRKKVCTSDQYDPQTREILPSCVRKIDEHYEDQDDGILKPKFVRVQALSPTPNDNFYYCKLLEKPVRKVRVAIPATHRAAIRPNLVFKAQVIEKGDEKFYRHEIIYKREFDRQERIKKIHS